MQLPTLDELEEEHWSIVVLAHRLAEAVLESPPPAGLGGMIDELCRRCEDHLRREEGFIRDCAVGPVDGLVSCQRYLRHLISVMRPADGKPVNGLAATMVAFEAALIMTLQHDRAVLSALHGLTPPPITPCAPGVPPEAARE